MGLRGNSRKFRQTGGKRKGSEWGRKRVEKKREGGEKMVKKKEMEKGEGELVKG